MGEPLCEKSQEGFSRGEYFNKIINLFERKFSLYLILLEEERLISLIVQFLVIHNLLCAANEKDSLA